MSPTGNVSDEFFGGQGVWQSGLVQALLGVELAAPISCLDLVGSVAVLRSR